MKLKEVALLPITTMTEGDIDGLVYCHTRNGYPVACPLCRGDSGNTPYEVTRKNYGETQGYAMASPIRFMR